MRLPRKSSRTALCLAAIGISCTIYFAVINHPSPGNFLIRSYVPNFHVYSSAIGQPPIVSAAMSGDVTLLKKLISEGSSPDTCDAGNVSALMMAATAGEHASAVVDVLLRARCNIEIVDSRGQNALMIFTAAGRSELAMMLARNERRINAQDSSGITALAYATSITDSAQLFETLLKCGADPNLAGRDGVSPMMRAASNGNLAALESLARHGARINDHDARGYTAVFYSVALNKPTCIYELNQLGADMNARESRLANTALIAFAASPDCIPAYKAIIACNADPSLINTVRMSAIDLSRFGRQPDKTALLDAAIARLKR